MDEKPSRWRFRFGLRSLLLCVTATGVAAGYATGASLAATVLAILTLAIIVGPLNPQRSKRRR